VIEWQCRQKDEPIVLGRKTALLPLSFTRQARDQHWMPIGVEFPQSVGPRNSCRRIRIIGGNFRLLNRLLTGIQRILEIDTLKEVTKAVVEATRESLEFRQL